MRDTMFTISFTFIFLIYPSTAALTLASFSCERFDSNYMYTYYMYTYYMYTYYMYTYYMCAYYMYTYYMCTYYMCAYYMCAYYMCTYYMYTYYMYTYYMYTYRFDDDSNFLRADYTIDCDGKTYGQFISLVIAFIFLYIFGVPALYTWYIWQASDKLDAINKLYLYRESGQSLPIRKALLTTDY